MNDLFNNPIKEKKCEFCAGTGHISMVHNTYSSVFACICEKGDLFRNGQKAMQWNGQKTQIYKNKEYALHWAYDEEYLNQNMIQLYGKNWKSNFVRAGFEE